MATSTTGIFGYTGTLGSTISARSRREPKYSKAQQTKMIRAILSRRMMSPPSYENVLDYVDSNVTYAENKREVLAVFGERSRKGRMITDKDMKDMYCDSLHNQCVSNGLETCRTACDECKNPTACDKAKQIKKEIKKHGRKLTHFERMEVERTKEAKRKVKKAKYSTGQVVKCREGYELQCGFSGVRKITQVKQYPDYVMYGIKGKAQGFVEEDWIVGVNVKGEKAVKTRHFGIKTLAETKKTIAKMKKEGKILHPADEGIFKTGYGKQCQICGYIIKSWNEWKRICELAPYKETFPRTGFKVVETHPCPKCHSEELSGDWRMVKQKPPKPTPTKVTKITKPSKKTTRRKMSNGVKVVKPKLKKPTGVALHPKALTKNQQALLRKYRFVDVSIQGKMYHVTKQNVKDGKIEWYRKNGKVCLKNKR